MNQPAKLGFEQGVGRTRGPRGRQLPALAKTDHGHGVVERFDFDARSRATAKFAGAPTVGHQAVAMDEDRIGILQQLDIAGHQRTETAQRPARRPTVHGLVRTGTGDDRGEHHRHVLVVAVARVMAGDIDPAGVTPGGGDTVGGRLLQCLAHRVGQGFHRRGGAVDVGRRLLRIAQGSRRAEVDGHAAVQPFVIRRRHLGEHHQPQVNPGH
ncbi:hypothetical protein D3C76_820840 [compost metagenome]